MPRTTLLIGCLSILLPAHATNYYIANNGNDANSGTSPASAWRTLAKVESYKYSFAPGDSILFRRGDTFRGFFEVGISGTASQPIVISAYGNGPKPILSGSEATSNWSPSGNGRWTCTTNDVVKHFYVDGERQILARYPNTGWLRNDSGNNNELQDAALTQPNGYWTGAEAVIRSSNWSYFTAPITSYSNSTLFFDDIYKNLEQYEWGYFMQNKLEELDTPGEWFYDDNAGVLHYMPPAGTDPNTDLLCEATEHDRGIIIQFNKHHIHIQDLHLEDYYHAAIDVQGADEVIIRDCEIERSYRAIRNYGAHLVIKDNHIHDTYGTGLWIIESGLGAPSEVEGNLLENIAVVPGLGESNWGYFGISVNGGNTVIRRNRLLNIGYIGITTSGNDIVIEENYLNRSMRILNDGSAIGFDQIDGGIVRYNVIDSVIGDLESAAPDFPSHVPIGNGIYYGNLFVKNMQVYGNTTANCDGAGIFVDHTLEFEDNTIIDNVMYNNNVQLQFSDNSADETPDVECPCFVPYFNTVVSGNTLVSLSKEQMTLDLFQTQATVAPFERTDFGDFSNNKHFNPYEPQSITLREFFPGGTGLTRHTLVSWQNELGEGTGSTETALQFNALEVTQELTSNLLSNGEFDGGSSGWSAFWPIDPAHMTHEQNGVLDQGYLNVHYDPLHPPFDHLTVQNNAQLNMPPGNWYRLRFSTASNNTDELRVQVKGATQSLSDPLTINDYFPVETQRREAEFIFQSTVPAGDVATLYFVNQDDEPQYYLDNVELREVQVTNTTPSDGIQLFYNDNADGQMNSMTFNLAGCFHDLDGNPVSNSITVAPYRSVVLVKMSDTPCTSQGDLQLQVRALLDGPYDPASGLMNDGLRASGAIVNQEPYQATYGHVGNGGGESLQPGVLDLTGPDAIVDWVMVELRSATDPTVVLQTRSGLIQRDGDVVDTDGSSPITISAASGSYNVALRHRNHLGVMTAQPIQLNSAPTAIDLTTSSSTTWGTEAQKPIGSVMVMWAGEVHHDGVLKYTGISNDRDPILVRIGGSVPTATLQGYWPSDVNMDGEVKYTGINNDRDPILVNIGGSVPTQTRLEQLP